MHPTKKAGNPRVSGLQVVDLVTSYSNLSYPCKTVEELGQLRQKLAPVARESAVQPAESIRNVRRRLGAERIGELVATYKNGTPTTTLIETYGLSKASVLKLLRREGVQLRRQPLTDDEGTEACRLYEAGSPIADVAMRLQLARESVRRELIARGVTMRQRGGSYA